MKEFAIVGHAIASETFFNHIKTLGRPLAFAEEASKKTWAGIEEFRQKYKRHPTKSELEEKGFEVRAFAIAKSEFGQDVILEEARWLAMRGAMNSALTDLARKAESDDHLAFCKAFDLHTSAIDTLKRTGATTRAQSFGALLDTRQAARKDKASGRIRFGISFLDDALHGLGKEEFAVVSAATGVGKTALMTMIARSACEQGYRVTLLALEAYKGEVQDRITYGIASKLYREAGGRESIAYDDWLDAAGEYPLDPYMEQAEGIAREKYGKLLTVVYRDGMERYTVDDMTRDITSAATKADIVLVDHLHYIDGDDSKDDNANMFEIVTRIRGLCDTLRIPVLAAAHLRKEDSMHKDTLLPSIHDIHGSSAISKIATFCIMLGAAKVFLAPGTSESGAPAWTFVRITKNRKNGRKTWPTAVMQFDPATDSYRDAYAIGALIKGDKAWEPMSPVPYWAKKHGTIRLDSTDDISKTYEMNQKVKFMAKERDAKVLAGLVRETPPAKKN